jgi:hypothetical protein
MLAMARIRPAVGKLWAALTYAERHGELATKSPDWLLVVSALMSLDALQ